MNSLADLTPRQQEVLELMCQGLTIQLMSERLHLSPHTVAEYRHLLMKRMGVANAVELVNLVNQQKQAKHSASLTADLQAALEKPPELIVVDDDDAYRQIVVSSLLQSGYPCRGADSSQTLTVALQEKPADIVLLDLNLGAEDGLDIAQQLSQDRQIGIIMMTTRGMVEHRIDGLAMGADAYLVKPVDMRELTGVIRNLHRRLTETRLAERR